jgi:hypothetical protein
VNNELNAIFILPSYFCYPVFVIGSADGIKIALYAQIQEQKGLTKDSMTSESIRRSVLVKMSGFERSPNGSVY